MFTVRISLERFKIIAKNRMEIKSVFVGMFYHESEVAKT